MFMTKTYPLHMQTLTKSVVFLSVLMAMNSELFAKEIAGKTIITRGVVQATDSLPGLQRILKRRSPIYGTDVVTTELGSKAQLRMTDGGMIALKENSELLIATSLTQRKKRVRSYWSWLKAAYALLQGQLNQTMAIIS
jgi:hypothetical protein